MSSPDDLDRRTERLGCQVVGADCRVAPNSGGAARRDYAAQSWAGSAEPEAERHGGRAEATGELWRRKRARVVRDSRGADRHIGPTAGLPLHITGASGCTDHGERHWRPHQAADAFCTQIGNAHFAWFGTASSKSRLNFLALLRAGYDDYVINAEALAYYA
jgi:hypothetical protein